jgi:hypothetical protein
MSDYDRRDSDREPNLVENGRNHGDYNMDMGSFSDSPAIKEDSVMRNTRGLQTTVTDMMWEYMADKNKCIDSENLQRFQKQEPSYDKRNKSATESDELKDLMGGSRYSEPRDVNPGLTVGPIAPSQTAYSSRNSDKNTDTSETRDDKKDSEFESEEDEMLTKLDMLRKLGELAKYGVKLSQNYSMNSDLKTMRYEYELHRSIRDKHNGVKWLSNMMYNVCCGIELANDKFDPFGFELKGWSEQINDDIDDYRDVFGEIYEKYFKTGKSLAPELKLFFMISGSAVRFHFAHAMMNSLPNLGEMMNKNPELADQLRTQAINDKIKKQKDAQREAALNAMNNEHMMGTQKASDIQMLRQAQQAANYNNRDDLSLENDIIRKQKEIEALQNEINLMRSETASRYSNTATPNFQQTMSPPNLPQRFRVGQNNEDVFRQQQILSHKKMMQQQELNKFKGVDIKSTDSSVNYNPNLDRIISNKVSEMSIIDQSDLNISDDSKFIIKKRRQKKK